jgi:phosphatidate cytidylyltransferase
MRNAECGMRNGDRAAQPAPDSAFRIPHSALALRLLTAAAGIPLLLLVVFVGGPLYTAVVAAALVLGFLEFARAMTLGRSALSAAGAITVAALALAAHGGGGALVAVLSAGLIVSLVVLVVHGEPPAGLAPWALTLAGVLYAGLLGQHAVGLRLLPDGRDWVVFALFTTFATDTGAYAIGRALGRHRLAPRLSPGKTVEGAAGGLIVGAAAAMALNAALDLGEPPPTILVLGAAAAVAAQLGDLAESLIKRAAGVKDMGTIIPGHGGVLDRLDSLLFVLPLIYYAARWWA